MNIILAKHLNCEKEYCFSVNDEQKDQIHEEDWLLVSTFQGIKLAIAVCDPFILDGKAIHLLINAGAKLPLKPVVAYCTKEMQKNMIIDYLISQKNKNNKLELPF